MIFKHLRSFEFAQLKYRFKFLIVIFSIGVLYLPDAFSEPWLSNRYAQNCSACHSPSRRNVEPIERRCTLSCQGCHENPNGGGLRNQWGRFNQQRWLTSYNSNWTRTYLDKNSRPAPLKKQQYANQPEKPNSKQLAAMQKYIKEGLPLVTELGADYDEKDYDRSDLQEKITASTKAEFLTRVTENDPYRQDMREDFYFGGDFRYVYLSRTRNADKSERFPMALNFGGLVRPTAYKNVGVVLETSFGNPPARHELSSAVTSEAFIKSAYININDLPYATYAMYGIYRPLFGYYTADHESLINRMIEFDQTYTARALTVGGSPNVPFANLHVILPKDKNNPQEKGFAANLGGRFVTLGGSFMFSYWKTTDDKSHEVEERFDRDLLSVNAGAAIPVGPSVLIANVDYTKFTVGSFDSITAQYLSDSGAVLTYDLKYKIWRESYITASWADSNVGYSSSTRFRRKSGSSKEQSIGFKLFPIAGTEFEITSIKRDEVNKVDSSSTLKYNYIQAQLHLFW